MKTKKFLSLVFALVMSFGMCLVALAADEVPEGYTPVYTADDLNSIRNNLSGKYILMNDIDLSSYEKWEPIGKSENPFNGMFDGNSFIVKNINISIVKGENPSVGLFGTVANSQIEDVTVIGQIDVDNDNGIRAGLICGEAYNSVVTGCITYGKIDVSTKAGVWVGGITGYLSTYSNTAEVRECKIEFCQNNADVSADAVCEYKPDGINYFVGGIAGLSEGLISKSSNHGDVTAVGRNGGYDYFYTLAGGICGNSDGETNNCYNVGNISSIGTKYVFAGGISGHWYQFGDIYNCYNIGLIKAEVKDATDDYNLSAAGGIIGEIEPLWIFDSEESIENIVSVYNCYYLNNAENAFGDVSPQNSINIKSLTTEEISKPSSFKGFDFENVWEMSEDKNRPVLQNGDSSDGDIMLPPSEDVEVSIIYAPLKSRIIYNKLGPDLSGIIIKITYFDGNSEIIKVRKVENGYTAGDYSVSSNCFFLKAEGQPTNYGTKEVGLYVSKHENNLVYEGVTKFNVLSIPNSIELFYCLKTIVKVYL